MKKYLFILLLIILVFSLVSCQEKEDEPEPVIIPVIPYSETPLPDQCEDDTTDINNLLGIDGEAIWNTGDFDITNHPLPEESTTMEFYYGTPLEVGVERENDLPLESGASDSIEPLNTITEPETEAFIPLPTEPADIPLEANTEELSQYAANELDKDSENLPNTSDSISYLFIVAGIFFALAFLLISTKRKRLR